jgi:hypothetical protein
MTVVKALMVAGTGVMMAGTVSTTLRTLAPVPSARLWNRLKHSSAITLTGLAVLLAGSRRQAAPAAIAREGNPRISRGIAP